MDIPKPKKNQPLLMGIINLTPDSFSDGGQNNTIKKALKKAKELEKEGADIIDLGGESTGPGSKDVKLEEELKRVIPVVKELRKRTKILISIDTYKSEVANQALEAGADMINDVTALRGDKKMASVIAKHGCPIILMYSKDKTARTTVSKKHYTDVTKTISQFLKKQISYAKKEGINSKQIIIDPGMGQFISSIAQYSLEIIAKLPELKKLKHPILIGVSRKSFLGQGSIEERDEKSKIVETIAYLKGASIIRTHNLKKFKTWQI